MNTVFMLAAATLLWSCVSSLDDELGGSGDAPGEDVDGSDSEQTDEAISVTEETDFSPLDVEPTESPVDTENPGPAGPPPHDGGAALSPDSDESPSASAMDDAAAQDPGAPGSGSQSVEDPALDAEGGEAEAGAGHPTDPVDPPGQQPPEEMPSGEDEPDAGPADPAPTDPGERDASASGAETPPPEDACGNASVDPGEECDDGDNDGSYGGCNADCTLAPRCGDGVVDADEQCDDGNDAERDGCSPLCTPWFDTAFTRRTRLDVENPLNDEVDSFPALVRVDDTVVDWDEVGSAGFCLVADDATTALAFEAESWEPGEESLLWVRVPTLAADATTTLWLYYGHSDDSGGCDSNGATWTDSFVGVWHLDGIADSSALGHTLTDTGTTDAPGVVGRGRHTDVDDNLSGTTDPTLHLTGDLTISTWIRFDDLGSQNYANALVTYGADTFSLETNYAYGLYGNDDGTLSTYWAHGNSTTVNLFSDVSGLTVDTFHHVALVRDTADGVVRFFLDGAQVGSDVPYPELPDGGEEGYFLLGGNVVGSEYDAVGVLDEFRIQNRAVQNAWVTLEYLSMTGELISATMDPP